MAHPSKRKGNTYERELVNQAKDEGFDSERAWGSDGRSLGHTADVDLLISTKLKDWKVQAKRRAKIAQYMQPSDNVDVQILREDYGDSLVVMKLETFFKLIR